VFDLPFARLGIESQSPVVTAGVSASLVATTFSTTTSTTTSGTGTGTCARCTGPTVRARER
jgi:hypothetical protein